MKKEIKEPKPNKNIAKFMAITGWAIITLAVTFGAGMYSGHSLAQPTTQTQSK